MKFEIHPWDYHIHSSRCGHAIGTLEDYIQSAIKKNFKEIGLSDHFPMFFLPSSANVAQYAMNLDEFPLYLDECEQLKRKYQNQLQIKIGSEVDYFPGTLDMLKKEIQPFRHRLDYIIGSIHVIQLEGMNPFPVDGPNILEKFEEFGEEKIYGEYYSNLIEMVQSDFYNIVGHCDLPKKFGTFLGKSENIWEFQLKFLDVVEKSEMAIEINHSGLYKPVNERYPNDRLIEEILNRQIPITFGSDSHDPKLIGYKFEETLQKLSHFASKSQKSVQLAKFENGRMKIISF